MTFKALVDHFASTTSFPIHVDSVLDWIRAHTDHKNIRLFPVDRKGKSFRGAFRRREINVSNQPYGVDTEIQVDIVFGEDLSDQWKRLVIVKEAIHVFDNGTVCIDSAEKLRKLIPGIVSDDLQRILSPYAFNDHLGVFRAMAILVPQNAREKLKESLDTGERNISEISEAVGLPDHYVDMWLKYGDQLDKSIFNPTM
jgi:hypothetical protein